MRQADAVIDIMAEKGFKRGVTVKRITTNEVLLMEQAFRQHSFNDPSGDCLSPVGEYNLRLGIMQQVRSVPLACISQWSAADSNRCKHDRHIRS